MPGTKAKKDRPKKDGPGRPAILIGGRPVKVYLDQPTIIFFTKLGEGEISPGIRKGRKLLQARGDMS